MKTKKALWIMAGLSAFSAAVMSGQIATLTTFTDGNVLTAAELNNNNAAIMTAVNDNNSKHKVYAIKDTGPAGGLVFHIENGGRNGLEAALEDLKDANGEVGVVWGCTGTEISGADGVLIERGATNTLDIVEQCTEADIASKLAYDYVSGGYTDWFLPSKDELNTMLRTLDFEASGAIAPIYYWSSSESGSATAWSQDSNDPFDQVDTAKSPILERRVRAVRAF
jgi:hypothetical protein